jgi:hypothetical protein
MLRVKKQKKPSRSLSVNIQNTSIHVLTTGTMLCPFRLEYFCAFFRKKVSIQFLSLRSYSHDQLVSSAPDVAHSVPGEERDQTVHERHGLTAVGFAEEEDVCPWPLDSNHSTAPPHPLAARPS